MRLTGQKSGSLPHPTEEMRKINLQWSNPTSIEDPTSHKSVINNHAETETTTVYMQHHGTPI